MILTEEYAQKDPLTVNMPEACYDGHNSSRVHSFTFYCIPLIYESIMSMMSNDHDF